MVELIKDLPASVVIAMLCGVLMLLMAIGKGLWWGFNEWYQNTKVREQTLNKSIIENTLAITRLQVEMEKLNELLISIPKLKLDIDLAHQKLRDIQRNNHYNLP